MQQSQYAMGEPSGQIFNVRYLERHSTYNDATDSIERYHQWFDMWNYFGNTEITDIEIIRHAPVADMLIRSGTWYRVVTTDASPERCIDCYVMAETAIQAMKWVRLKTGSKYMHIRVRDEINYTVYTMPYMQQESRPVEIELWEEGE